MFGARSTGPRHGGDGLNPLRDGRAVQLSLYKTETCPYCVRVFRVIDALGVSVEYRDTGAERRWRDDLRTRTGRTTVPCLLVDGRPLFESADIAAWLQEHFGARRGDEAAIRPVRSPVV